MKLCTYRHMVSQSMSYLTLEGVADHRGTATFEQLVGSACTLALQHVGTGLDGSGRPATLLAEGIDYGVQLVSNCRVAGDMADSRQMMRGMPRMLTPCGADAGVPFDPG